MKKNYSIKNTSLLALLMFTQPMVSSLYEAAWRNKVEHVNKLLKNGADREEQGQGGRTALHYAALYGRTPVIKALIDIPHHKAFINIKDRHDQAPLHYSAHQGHEEATELLITKGADIEARDKKGRTPLHRAVVKERNKGVVVMFLKHGAHKDAQDIYGDTPLHLAAYSGCKAIVEILLSADASVQQRNKDGQIPLAKALAAWDAYNLLKLQIQQKSNTYAEIIGMLLLMDNAYGEENLSLYTEELLKDNSFDLGQVGIDLLKSKKLQKEDYTRIASTLFLYHIPKVLLDLIIEYYDSFELRKSLFTTAQEGVLEPSV